MIGFARERSVCVPVSSNFVLQSLGDYGILCGSRMDRTKTVRWKTAKEKD
jgi:hypothetical protein